MKRTKQNILDSALKLFNKNGIVNVRLQHIADEAFVSVGNLAYHFPNKEAIVMSLYEKLTQKQRELLLEYRIVPLFDNIDRLIYYTFQLQQAYIFFYIDTLEIVRAYPVIGEAHQQHINFQISQLEFLLEFNVSRGALIEEPLEGVFQHLSTQIWMTMDFWLSQQSVRKNDTTNVQLYRKAVWNLFIPLFTNVGRQEYGQMLQLPYF
ncbi:MAG: TetR/AcrR family transcriptional regulator [Bacteroidota bacterium]